MIKSLLDDDEDRDSGEEPRSGFFKKGFRSEGIVSIDLSSEADDDPDAPGESEDEIRSAIISGPPSKKVSPKKQTGAKRVAAAEQRPADTQADILEKHERRAAELERKLQEIEEELRREKESFRASRLAEETSETSPGSSKARERFTSEPSDRASRRAGAIVRKPVIPSFTSPPSAESRVETIRNSGLAWSAAIALFGSVIFMLVLGWFADLLLGSSPWGVVTGIVIGSVIGFYQFFRMTSQIRNPEKSDFDKVSLKSDDGENETSQDNTQR